MFDLIDVSIFTLSCILISQASKIHPALTWLTSFPGLVCHELAHYSIAFILGAKPEKFSLIPETNKDGSWTLGSVHFYPSWWNGSLVALAPLLLFPLSGFLYLEYIQNLELENKVGFLFLLATLCWQAMPSKADWVIAVSYPAPAIAGLVGAYFYWAHG